MIQKLRDLNDYDEVIFSTDITTPYITIKLKQTKGTSKSFEDVLNDLASIKRPCFEELFQAFCEKVYSKIEGFNNPRDVVDTIVKNDGRYKYVGYFKGDNDV